MTTNIRFSAGVRFDAPSQNQPVRIQHEYDWYDPEDSAQGEPLTLEALTRYGQPISCSIVDRGWVFISYGQENLCIREQIRMLQRQNHIVFLNETDFHPDQEISVGWSSSNDQRMSVFGADYPARQTEIDSRWDITAGDDPRLVFDFGLTGAITTADIDLFLQGTEAPYSLDELARALQPAYEGWSLPTTATPLLARESDVPQVTPDESLAEALPPSPDIIENNYQQRIHQLESIAEDEDIFVSSKSCDDFWLFIRNYRSSPQAGLILTDEGNLVAIWRDTTGSTVEVEFQGDEQCKLIVFKDPRDPLRVLPDISRDTLASIGERIGGLSFLHSDQ